MTAPPRIRIHGEDFLLVPAHDVIQIGTLEDGIRVARDLLAADDTRSLQRTFGDDPERLAVELGRHLANGNLKLIRIADAPRLIDAPRSQPLAPDEPTPSTPTDAPTTRPSWIEIHCRGAHGESYAGAMLHVRLPDRTVRTARLDRSSRWRADDIPGDGTCQVELRIGQQSSPDVPALEGFEPVPDMPRIQPGHEPLALATAKAHTLVVAPPTKACVRLIGMSFALDKAFVLPRALEGIRLLKHMYDKMPGAEVLLVGHTDTTGSKRRNLDLSHDRAAAVAAYLRDDVDAWLAFYGSGEGASRRWDGEEDLAMLTALPIDHPPYYGPHHADHTFEGAVRRFQEAHLLPPTGKPDAAFRRALIGEYMAQDETTLPADVSVVAHGCGQDFQRVETGDQVEELENRRVEAFFFAHGIDPPPPGPTSNADDGLYPRWLEGVEEERTFRPSAQGRGLLRLVTDIEAEFASEAEVSFMLESVDGVYTSIKTPHEHGSTAQGYVDLLFEDVPRLSFLTLKMRDHEGSEQILFEDIPYAELGKVGNLHDDPLVDPFTFEVVE